MAVELLESLSRSIVEFETGPLLGPMYVSRGSPTRPLHAVNPFLSRLPSSNDAIGAFDKHFPEPWRSFLFGPQVCCTAARSRDSAS